MATQTLPPTALPSKVEIQQSKVLKKRAALYARVSTGDQHPETQLLYERA
jgi:predicted site-specific integrase-resolvase